jgi:hypothetical protein
MILALCLKIYEGKIVGIQFTMKGDYFDGMYDKGISEIHEDQRL